MSYRIALLVLIVALTAAVLVAGLSVGGALRQAACVEKTNAQLPITYVEKGSGVFERGAGWRIAGASPHLSERKLYEWREEQLARC
jgi:hypothetical protein